MKAVIWTQFLKDKRNPLVLLLLIAGAVIATLVFTGGMNTPMKVAIFSEEENASEMEAKWEALLNTNDSFQFVIADPEEARKDVREGKADVAVRLMDKDYRLIAAREMPNVYIIEQHVDQVFREEAQLNAIAELSDNENARETVEKYLADAPFQMEKQGLHDESTPNFDMRTQLLFAFTFLIAMMISGFRVNNVNLDKVSGIWNRMILSPISKTSMYTGYIVYSFLITMFQVFVVLALFKYVMNYNLGDHFGLILLISACFTFSMISIAMLLTGLVTKPDQFYAIYPSLIPIIPIISGAYMPPGTITNPVLLFIADLFPLAHAMEAILSVIFYHAGFQDVIMQMLFMLIIGIVAMGIGINLIERRSN